MSFREPTAKKLYSLRPAAIASVCVLLIMLVSAVVFYKERMLFIDAPHILFRIVNDSVFQINDFRYGSFVTQMVPYAGSKIGLPLKWLMVLYSASFYTFFLIVTSVLVFVFRNYPLAIISGLYYTIFVSDTFYWPNNEIHQGVAWMLLSLGTILYLGEKQKPFLLVLTAFIPLFFLSVWTHPLVVPTIAYLWGFYLLSEKTSFSRKQQIMLSTLLLLFLILKLKQGTHQGYDSTKMELVTGFDIQRLKSISSSPQWRFFTQGCLHNYWLFVILFVTGLATLIYEKRYLLLGWTLAVSSAYLLLVCITYWSVDASMRFYIESEYMPLTIICCAPFVFFTLPRFNRNICTAVIVVIFLVRLLYIYKAAPLFQNRLAIMENIAGEMKKKGLSKVIIPTPPGSINDQLLMNWGAPVESFMNSALNGEMPQRTFLFATADEIKMIQHTGADTFLGCWERRPVSHINAKYFSLDTTSRYQVVPFDSLMSK